MPFSTVFLVNLYYLVCQFLMYPLTPPFYLYNRYSQSVVHWRPLKPFQRICDVKTVFIILLRLYFAFPLSLCHECKWTFSRGYMICDDIIPLIANEMCETHMKIQVSSIKPDLKGICKNVKWCHSSNYIFWEKHCFS